MCSCGDDHDDVVSGQHIYAGGEQLTVSRRDLLRGGAAAVIAGGAAALFAQAPASAQAAGAQAQLRVFEVQQGRRAQPAARIVGIRRGWGWLGVCGHGQGFRTTEASGRARRKAAAARHFPSMLYRQQF